MKIFLITYYADNQDDANDAANQIIRGRTWARINPYSWCIKVNDNVKASNLRDYLSQNLRENVTLFVVDITNSNWGSFRIPRDVTEWLKEG